jgi:hypothetical protein
MAIRAEQPHAKAISAGLRTPLAWQKRETGYSVPVIVVYAGAAIDRLKPGSGTDRPHRRTAGPSQERAFTTLNSSAAATITSDKSQLTARDRPGWLTSKHRDNARLAHFKASRQRLCGF